MQTTTLPYAALRLESPTFRNPRQRQIAPEDLRELALHLARRGLQYPLRVTPDGTITGGQRRYLAIGLMLAWRTELAAEEIGDDEHELFDARSAELAAGVPCILDTETDPAELVANAVADNLLREPMASYDVAEQVVALQDQDWSVTAIATRIGRSKTYVSRMISTWRNACPLLHTIWASGQLAYEQVKAIAEHPPDEQERLIAGPAPRGGHGRPGIETVKSLLADVKRRAGDDPYRRGLLDAWRVVTGELPVADLRAALEAAP